MHKWDGVDDTGTVGTGIVVGGCRKLSETASPQVV
jgi:hypothetical protein